MLSATEENARLTATVIKPQGVKKIVLVTDPPHLLRSLLTFRSFGFTVNPRTSPLPPGLSPRQKTLMVFYEYLGLISYGLQGRFFPQRLPEVTNYEQPLSYIHFINGRAISSTQTAIFVEAGLGII